MQSRATALAPIPGRQAVPTPGPRPAPPGGAVAGGLDVLHVVLWDLHAARHLAARVIAAGVPRDLVGIRGRRVTDGLAEADVRDRRRFHTRWRTNLLVAVVGGLIVGPPVGASLATVVLGETAGAAISGGTLLTVGLVTAGVYAVLGDHLQWLPGSRHETRVEGHLVVRGREGVGRAEMLVTTTEDVMVVERLPIGADPLDW